MSGAASIGTSPSLLEGIKDPKNNRRWAMFDILYADFIRRLALSHKVRLRPHEAEEVVQNVLIEVSRKIGEFDYDPSQGGFRKWLAGVTYYKCMEINRKRSGEEAKQGQVHRRPDDSGDTNTIDRIADPHESDFEKVIDDEWDRAFLAATLKRVKEMVEPIHYQIYDSYVLKERAAEEVSKTYDVTKQVVFNVKSRVGKIVQEQGMIMAAEMKSAKITEHQEISNNGKKYPYRPQHP